MSNRKMIFKCELDQEEIHELISREVERRAFLASKVCRGRSTSVELGWILSRMTTSGPHGSSRVSVIAEVFDEQITWKA